MPLHGIPSDVAPQQVRHEDIWRCPHCHLGNALAARCGRCHSARPALRRRWCDYGSPVLTKRLFVCLFIGTVVGFGLGLLAAGDDSQMLGTGALVGSLVGALLGFLVAFWQGFDVRRAHDAMQLEDRRAPPQATLEQIHAFRLQARAAQRRRVENARQHLASQQNAGRQQHQQVGRSFQANLLLTQQHSIQEQSGTRRTHPAQHSSVNELPTHIITAGEVGAAPAEHRSCTICLEEFKAGDKQRTLPCFHRFHTACVDRWLSHDGSCPICKHRVDGEDVRLQP